MFWSRRVRVASAVAAVAALVLLAGDVASTAARCPGQCQVANAAQTLSTPQPPAPKPAALRVSPRPSSEDVNPAAAVSVAAFTGTIDDVTMVNDAGKPIPGVLTPDKKAMAADRPAGLRTHLHHDDRRPRARRHAVPPDLELHHPVAGATRPRCTSTPPPAPCSRTAAPTGSASSSSRTSTIADHRQGRRRAHLQVTTNPPVPDPGTGSTTRTPIGGPRSITPRALR